MAEPDNHYMPPPSVCITKSFEAAVDAMDEASPSNSSAPTSTPKSGTYPLDQLAAHAEDPQEVAINDVNQELDDFTDNGPPSLHFPLMEDYFHMDHQPHIFWANLCIPLLPNPANPFEVLFDCLLVKFVAIMMDEDNCFAVLPTI